MNTHRALICYATFAVAQLCHAQTPMHDNSKRETASTQKAEFKKLLQEFKTKSSAVSLEDLSKAENRLDTAFTGMEILELQLLLLEAIMSRFDKGYDPKNPPQYFIRIAPPLSSNASSIETAEYQKKVRENEVIAKHVHEQSKIRFMKSRILSYLQMSVKYQSQSEDDKKAKQMILDFIDNSSLDSDAKNEVIQMVAPQDEAK